MPAKTAMFSQTFTSWNLTGVMTQKRLSRKSAKAEKKVIAGVQEDKHGIFSLLYPTRFVWNIVKKKHVLTATALPIPFSTSLVRERFSRVTHILAFLFIGTKKQAI